MKGYNQKKRSWWMRLLFGKRDNDIRDDDVDLTIRRSMNRDTAAQDRMRNNEKNRRRQDRYG